MNSTMILLFGLVGVLMIGAFWIQVAGRWDRGVKDITAAVACIVGASRADADKVLAVVRLEVADLLEVHLEDVTAKGTYGLELATSELLQGVAVTIYGVPSESLTGIASDLETSVQSLLIGGGDFEIRVRARREGAWRPSKRSA